VNSALNASDERGSHQCDASLDPIKWAQQYRALSDQIDATDPNLLPFYQRSGALIV
jgi:hypothetical protein